MGIEDNSHKKKTLHETTISVVVESYIGIFQKVFHSLSSEVRKTLEEDYKIFMEAIVELAKERPKGDYNPLVEVRKKMPDNKWVPFFLSWVERNNPHHPSTPGSKERISKNFREAVSKKLKGKDIH